MPVRIINLKFYVFLFYASVRGYTSPLSMKKEDSVILVCFFVFLIIFVIIFVILYIILMRFHFLATVREKKKACGECGNQYEKGDQEDWFRCSGCKQWYHRECLDLDASAVEDMYFVFNSCDKCANHPTANAEQPIESEEEASNESENEDEDEEEKELDSSDSDEEEGESEDGDEESGEEESEEEEEEPVRPTKRRK